MKKEMLKMMMKKYNCQELKVVDKINPQDAGALSNGEFRIVFDVQSEIFNIDKKRVLLIEDVITKDNIHLYYEFMSDEDIKTYKDILNISFRSRKEAIEAHLSIDLLALDSSKFIFNNCYLINSSIFGIEDTLKPIDEYIEEIKAGSEYKEYISRNIQKEYYIQNGIGKAKYIINFYDGKSTHKDGSKFFAIKIFTNKKELIKYEKELIKDGYTSTK